MNQIYAQRIQKLQNALGEQGIDAYFASTPTTMGYLAGFHEGGGERMMLLGIAPGREAEMLVPALSHTQATDSTGLSHITTWSDGEDPGVPFQAWAERWGLRTGVMAVDDEMIGTYLLRMQEALPAGLFKLGTSIMEACRGRKEPEEIAALRRAGAAVDKAYAAGLAAFRPGVKEREIQLAIRDATLAQGLDASFGIVATGANGARPHHLTSDAVVQPGDVVVMDFGATADGYQADITRMACLGTAEEEAKKVYRIVRDAHYAARDAAKPGVAAQEVDRAARKVIADAGYGQYFCHRTGHGIGLQVHEAPYIVEGNETILREGHSFTVEPGVYLPGRFGVRIENVVTITANGCESLNAEPEQELRELSV